MNSYNLVLKKLREHRNLTIRQLGKLVGISSFSLYLYERGYFRPGKKALAKLEGFYQQEISLEGLDAYPAANEDSSSKYPEKRLLRRRIIFGSLSLLTLVSTLTGVFVFNDSVNNKGSYYGETYNSLKTAVEQHGTQGHDIVTGLKYYQYNADYSMGVASIIFYGSDNLLYFNECSYSTAFFDNDFGSCRIHYIFDGGLGTDSYICSYSFLSASTGSYFTCNFHFDNKNVAEVNDFKVFVQGSGHIVDVNTAIKYINRNIDSINMILSRTMEMAMGKKADFYTEFLPDREKGRTINYALQATGLLLTLASIPLFFLFACVFIRLLIVNVRPRLVHQIGSDNDKTHPPLPKDINMPFGIPDFFIMILARVLTIFAFGSMIVGFLSKLGVVPLPEFLQNDVFSFIIQACLYSGVFLSSYSLLVRNKRPIVILKKIINNVFVFSFIATYETIVVGITNAWGYDMASILSQFLPGNVFQLVAVHLAMYLFLFFRPSFLKNKASWIRGLWHGLSLIPLGLLFLIYYMSNLYALQYGAKANVFVDFWFPNGFLPITIVSTVFMYTMFFLHFFYEKKYGVGAAQKYFCGDRFTLTGNIICASLLIAVGVFDLFFIHSQVGYYLNLGHNGWIFLLVPVVLLCKYSPNHTNVSPVVDELSTMSRDLS